LEKENVSRYMSGHLPMDAHPGLFESGVIYLNVILEDGKKTNQCCNKQNYRLKKQGEILLSLKTFGWILFLRQYYFTLFLGYFNFLN
jgi:hypothetical protein